MSRKIILIKQELLLLVYELNRSGLLAENEKIRPILAQLEKLLLFDLSPSTNDYVIFFFKQKTAYEFALNILLVGLTIIFVFATATIPSYVAYAGGAVPLVVLVALFVTL